MVVKSCSGEYACYYAEQVLRTVNSCNGDGACFYIGVYSSSGSATRAVRDSCNGYYACASAAYKGSIGNITSSCNAKYACYEAGSLPPNGTGLIDSNMTSCCNSESQCKDAKESSLPALCFPATPVSFKPLTFSLGTLCLLAIHQPNHFYICYCKESDYEADYKTDFPTNRQTINCQPNNKKSNFNTIKSAVYCKTIHRQAVHCNTINQSTNRKTVHHSTNLKTICPADYCKTICRAIYSPADYCKTICPADYC